MNDLSDLCCRASDGYSHEHFPILPITQNLTVPKGIHPNDDPFVNHMRWSGFYRDHLIFLPTGTASGVMAVVINKPNPQNSADGVAAFQRLVHHYGRNTDTAFFEDEHHRVYLYECHDQFIIGGAVTVAEGIKVYGNGAGVILPPYPCNETNRIVGWEGGLKLTRENLAPIQESFLDYVHHVLNCNEDYRYHFRTAA